MNPASAKRSKQPRSSSNPKSRSISSQATCKLCSKFFTDPRLLPCLHSFCFKCLTSKTKSCPTCKKAFKLPEGGLSALPKDLRKQYEVEVAEYALKIETSSDIACDRCLDSYESNATTFCCNCCKFLCSKCTQDHTRHRETHSHKLVELGKERVNTKTLLDSIPHKTASCQLHSDEVLKFYCETCKQLVCRDCIILKHNNHKYDRVEQVAEKGKQQLKYLLLQATSAADQLKTSASEADKMIALVQKKKASVDELIKSEFKKLREAIETREKTLLAKNREVNFQKETALKIQQESMTRLQVSIQQVSKQISEALIMYSSVELLSAQAAMETGLTEIKTQFDSFPLKLCKTDSISTSFTTTTIMADIEGFGEVTGGSCARNGTVSLYSSVMIQGKKKVLNVCSKDIDGKPYKNGGENVVAYLTPLDSGGKTSTFTAEDNNDGTYSVTVTPPNTGEHSLDIKIGNESIQSSPFIVYVRTKRNYNNLSLIRQINTTCSPCDVTVSGNKLFIVSSVPHIIVADKDSGTLLDPITCPSEVGQLNGQSFGITVQDDFLYISHNGNGCIYKLTTEGKYVATIGSRGTGNGQLQTPRGLYISSDGELYVAERSNNRVSVFKTDGTFIRHIQGNMNGPWGVAMDTTRNIHVSNFNSSVITVYNHEGQYLHQYGSGQFTNPIGIAVTADGFSTVVEYSYSKVLIFNTSDHSRVATLQDINQGFGATCDRDGYIYVCDYQNQRIVKY